MKRVAVFAIVLVAAFVSAAVRPFSATLSPRNEVNAANIQSKATGTAKIWIDDQNFTFEGFIQVTNLTTGITGYHVHMAAPGVNGPIVIDLGDNEESRRVSGKTVRLTFSGEITDKIINSNTVTRTQIVNAIKSGNAYVNVHTTKYPGGEVRGQLR